MPFQWTSNRQYAMPSAASAVSITPNSSAWANSAWVTLLASAPTGLLLTGISLVTPGDSQPFEVDIGVGSASNESVITTFRGQYRLAGFQEVGYVPHVVPLDAIPQGSRVSARLRKAGTSTTAWLVAGTYLRKPITGNLQTTTQPQLIAPSSAILTITSDASAWGNGAWTELLSSASADLLLSAVVIPAATTSFEWEIDLGIGAAASESVITTFRGVRTGSAGGPSVIPLPNILDTIVSGSRVSARIRTGDTAARNTTIALVYHEAPL